MKKITSLFLLIISSVSLANSLPQKQKILEIVTITQSTDTLKTLSQNYCFYNDSLYFSDKQNNLIVSPTKKVNLVQESEAQFNSRKNHYELNRLLIGGAIGAGVGLFGGVAYIDLQENFDLGSFYILLTSITLSSITGAIIGDVVAIEETNSWNNEVIYNSKDKQISNHLSCDNLSFLDQEKITTQEKHLQIQAQLGQLLGSFYLNSAILELGSQDSTTKIQAFDFLSLSYRHYLSHRYNSPYFADAYAGASIMYHRENILYGTKLGLTTYKESKSFSSFTKGTSISILSNFSGMILLPLNLEFGYRFNKKYEFQMGLDYQFLFQKELKTESNIILTLGLGYHY